MLRLKLNFTFVFYTKYFKLPTPFVFMAEQKVNPANTLYSYEVKREGGEDALYVNYIGAPFVPSLS